MKTDKIKDRAAKHWHSEKLPKRASLSSVFRGASYETMFSLHQIAFVAGYRAAHRDAKKVRQGEEMKKPAWFGFVGAVTCHGTQLFAVKHPGDKDFSEHIPSEAVLTELVIMTERDYKALVAKKKGAKKR